MISLIRGLHRFKTEIHAPNKEFFDDLSDGQAPHCLFITCSDSRVSPNLITQTVPGELFVLRNAGNIVPPYNDRFGGGEEATIEYAVVALGIKDIIVCGHSNCGAMAGLLKPESLEGMPSVGRWLKYAQDTVQILNEYYGELDEKSRLNALVQENVLMQLEHLKSLPFIARRIWKRELSIHGWVYDIESGDMFMYDPVYEQFCAIHHHGDYWHLVAPSEDGTTVSWDGCAPERANQTITHIGTEDMKYAMEQMAKQCIHLLEVKDVQAKSPHCEECSATGDDWVNLHYCRICGKVGCCDKSKNQHAVKHYLETGHSIMQSLGPASPTAWCHVDKREVEAR